MNLKTTFSRPIAAPPVLLRKYSKIIERDGVEAAKTHACRLAFDRLTGAELVYVPFEHLNRSAKLVIVGITPGPNQLVASYDSVQADLAAGIDIDTVIANAKRHGAFGGPAMRPNLVRMLDTLDFSALLGVSDVADLWDQSSHLLHATSVVPHAAFVGDRKFAGSFADVMESDVFRECFERDFAASLPLILSDALYVALGKTPLDALEWCVGTGLLRKDQVLGALAHPSREGGTRVDVYLGARHADDLDPKDPVRHSFEWLTVAAKEMRAALTAQGCSPRTLARKTPIASTPTSVPRSKPASAKASVTPAEQPTAPAAPGAPPSGLYAVIDRGKNKGAYLRPQVVDGHHIVSSDKHRANYRLVPIGQSLEPYFAKGLGIRMDGPPGRPASFIKPESIRGRTST